MVPISASDGLGGVLALLEFGAYQSHMQSDSCRPSFGPVQLGNQTVIE
jgi:hypothetical protein